MDQPSLAPTRKVASAGGAGAIVLILVWLLETYAGADIPAEVAAAATTLISLAVAYMVSDKPTPRHRDDDGDGVADHAQG